MGFKVRLAVEMIAFVTAALPHMPHFVAAARIPTLYAKGGLACLDVPA